MSISIWDYEKPLDAMMLSHDHIAMLVMKHEQQIKDIEAKLLELKSLVTPIMEFKRREWVGLTEDEIEHLRNDQPWWMVRDIEARLKEKNT